MPSLLIGKRGNNRHVIVYADLDRFDRQIVAEEMKVSSEVIIAAAMVLIAEIEMQIFELQAPTRAEHIFDARANSPPC